MKGRFHIHNTQNGFTLLFAMLVATIVVAIGTSIISISVRQTILSSTSRESQYAYYAASTGLNCAFYWDREPQMPTGFEGKSVFKSYFDTTENTSLTGEEFTQLQCAGYSLSDIIIEDSDPENIETNFKLEIKPLPGSTSFEEGYYLYCADVTVRKFFDTDKLITTIESKGYNNCEPTSPRRVERGLIQQYES